jgi:hypothetical protein
MADVMALGCMHSIEAIAQESNANGTTTRTADVTDLLQDFGVDENRTYIDFVGMPGPMSDRVDAHLR